MRMFRVNTQHSLQTLFTQTSHFMHSIVGEYLHQYSIKLFWLVALFSISLGAHVSHYLFINHLNCQYNKQCKMMIFRMMDVLPSSEVCWSCLLLTSASQGALTILFIILHSKENSFLKEIFVN